MGMNIRSRVFGEQVYVHADDIIKSLYSELVDIQLDSEIREYIKAQINYWERYQEDILKQHADKKNKSWFKTF